MTARRHVSGLYICLLRFWREFCAQKCCVHAQIISDGILVATIMSVSAYSICVKFMHFSILRLDISEVAHYHFFCKSIFKIDITFASSSQLKVDETSFSSWYESWSMTGEEGEILLAASSESSAREGSSIQSSSDSGLRKLYKATARITAAGTNDAKFSLTSSSL